MADVTSTLTSWSSTAASNLPANSAAVGPNTLADNQRVIQAVVRAALAGDGTIASATTTDLSTVNDGDITVTGTTTITGLGTLTAGIKKVLTFSGTLILTHNATSLILPGAANITTAAGDVAIMRSLGSGNWKCIAFTSITGNAATATLAAYATNAPLSFRNKIINGDMRIDQRNAGAAVTPTASTYLVDRFTAGISQASKLTFQQVADAPTGFKFSTKITVASQFAPAAGDFFSYDHRIEGQNIVDLAFGTASASSITVSFYAKTSVAGTYSASLVNADGTRTYVFSVTLTTSWARYTVTIPGETTGTWATDNTTGLTLRFSLGIGTNFQTASPNTWLAGNYLAATGSTLFVNQTAGATLNITGVQLEAGTVATPFENRPIGTEFALCQRYYEIIDYCGFIGNAYATNQLVGNAIKFSVSKRAVPTVTLFNVTENINTTNLSVGPVNISGLRIYGKAISAGDSYYTASAIVDAEL